MTDVKEKQPLKTLAPIIVTLVGILIDVNAEHPMKAAIPNDDDDDDDHDDDDDDNATNNSDTSRDSNRRQ